MSRRPPPRLAELVLRLAVRDREASDGLLGDLEEEYARLRKRGADPGPPGRWYWRSVLQLSGAFLIAHRNPATRGRRSPKNKEKKGMIEPLLKDLRYIFHGLRRSPGFTIVAVLTLAVGIGANVAMFSITETALLRPLPYDEPHRLVLGLATSPEGSPQTVSAHNYVDIRERSSVFESLGAMTPWPWFSSVTGGEEPLRLPVAWVSANLFRALGVDPILGRPFTAGEEVPGAPEVAIISEGFWQMDLGGDPEAVGRVLDIDGAPHTVVGVMPAGFRILRDDVDLWLPMRLGEAFAGARRYGNFIMIGRLGDGVSIEQAQSRLDAIAASLAAQHPETNQDRGLLLTDLQDALTESYRTSLLALLGAVGFVLLIACSNVASLLLVRGSTRHAELSVRAALGASRGRLLSQLLTEGLMISLAGGVLGTVLAVWSHQLIFRFLPFDMPQISDPGLSSPMLIAALALSVATGLVIGIFPAFRAARGDVVDGLRAGVRTTDGRGTWVRSGLVTVQVALSMVLLIGSTLLIRSFAQLRSVDPGFDPENLLTTDIELPKTGYEEPDRRVLFFSSLEEKVRAIPGVVDVAMVNRLPIRSGGGNTYVYPPGERPPEGTRPRTANERWVFPGYFEAMGMPILRGRGIEATDRANTPPVLVINQTMAEVFFPGEDPIGKRLIIDYDEETIFEVVGVLGNVRFGGPGQETFQAMYHSYFQEPVTRMGLGIRIALEPSTIVPALKGAVEELDPSIPLSDVAMMDELVAGTMGDERVMTVILSLFAWIALFLTTLGLYGVLAYYVNQRVPELGLRIALGAGPRQVVTLVLHRGLGLVAVGMALGLAGSLAATRLLQRLLFGIDPADPATFAVVSVFFLGVGLAACLIPARRAVRIDPVIALRAE